MSTSQGSDQGSPGSSRYDSSPVGGYESPEPPGGDGYSGAPRGGGYESPEPPGGGGYDDATPGTGHGPGTPPGAPGNGNEPGGYGPEDPSYRGKDPGGQDPGQQDPGQQDPGQQVPSGKSPGGYPGGENPRPPDGPPASHPCPPSMTCDTRGIDDLECEAKGVKAESQALDAVAQALATRRTAFETARAAYTKARDDAVQAVKDLNRKVDDLLDDTRCLLNRDVFECIDNAFDQVLECLQDCSEDQGCCIDCAFEKQSWSVGQMDDLRVRVEKVEKCFDEVLVKEPAALTKRIEDAKKWVTELTDALKADPREDANRLYARAKRLRWVLDTIWGRFADVNKFQDCLCCGLSCSLRGRQWLAQLAGKKAYQECQDAAQQRRCQWLRDNLVDETLATQLVLCPPGPPCGAEPEAPPGTSG